jgi:putative ABC transport system ATP-binding protein
MTGVAVRCEDVVHIYRSPEDEIVALRGVDLAVPAGESVALLGPSGSGKSTLLALLGGLLRPSAGRLWIGSDEIGGMRPRALLALRASRVSTVLQGSARNLLPYATALDNIRFAQRVLGRSARRSAADAAELLDSLGLGGISRQPVGRLSGGEQQRIALAVAVANSPGLLLADEPTSQLDVASRDEVLDLLDRINTAGTTVISVTHDPVVANRAARQIRMRFGRVGEQRSDTSAVGPDGSIRLPEVLLSRWPPGTPVTVTDDGGGLRIRRAAPETGPR